MLTTNELKDQLDADVSAAPSNIDRTSQVRSRVAVVRRRRAVGTGLAAVAGLAVAALIVVPQLDDHATGLLPSTHSNPSDEGDTPLAQYHLGGLLIAESHHTGSSPPDWLVVTREPGLARAYPRTSRPTTAHPKNGPRLSPLEPRPRSLQCLTALLAVARKYHPAAWSSGDVLSQPCI